MPQEIVDAGGYSISRRISSDNSSKPQSVAGFPTLIRLEFGDHCLRGCWCADGVASATFPSGGPNTPNTGRGSDQKSGWEFRDFAL
ncbi:hypothetical protein CC2G_004532 [Coprinopsis cinerea AmutBmut pab1-1]|nr:hypothetical protein CC2G_004532 [Coprinopsis cinerea AmutBmut pab1-1]